MDKITPLISDKIKVTKLQITHCEKMLPDGTFEKVEECREDCPAKEWCIKYVKKEQED